MSVEIDLDERLENPTPADRLVVRELASRGPCPVYELVASTRLSRTAVTDSLSRLRDAGVVEWRRRPGDLRERLYALR